MKYDDAEYCFLNFETDRLPNEAGGTHMGMYLAWAASRGLLGSGFDAQVLAPLKTRAITGSELLFDRCDGKLWAMDFNELGNAFTASYYNASFVADYERVFADQIPNGGATTDDFCSVPDTWENHERLASMLDERFAQWQQAQAAPATPAPTAARPPLSIAEDPAKAVEAIRARAKGGNAEAWFDLGVEYVNGQRVPRDMVTAADAFTRGAERGSVKCQFNLGVCFQRGDGRPQEPGKALHWFSQAANGGHAEGLYQLAMAYRTGAGLPLDPVAANALMLLAQSKDSVSAREAGITAGTLAESTELMARIRQPGQLLLTLARRRMAAANPGSARPAPLALHPAPSVPDTARVAVAGQAPVGGAAVIALLVGAVGFIVMLLAMSWMRGTALQALAGALGAVAAFGAYRCSRGLGSSAVVAALLAVLAFLPVFGSLVCLALVLQIYRQHRTH